MGCRNPSIRTVSGRVIMDLPCRRPGTRVVIILRGNIGAFGFSLAPGGWDDIRQTA